MTARDIIAMEPPTTVDEALEQLNLVQRILEKLEPESELQQAIGKQLEAIQSILRGSSESLGGDVPDGVIRLLQEILLDLDQQIQGQANLGNLPVGLRGTAQVDIQAGQTGLASFLTWAGEFFVFVEADTAINAFQEIRINGQENLAEPVNEPQNPIVPRTIVHEIHNVGGFDGSVNAAEDILMNDLRPSANGATYRVSVSLSGTAAVFQRRNKPRDGASDGSDEWTDNFNGNASTVAVGASELFEFPFDVSRDIDYNFRVDAATTVQEILVNEIRARS